MDAVRKYRLRRDRRLRERGIRLDGRRLDDEEENENQNAGNNGGGNTGKSGGGHGNTRLPFGLCKRFGIDVDPSWQPRDAWDALADKGITPQEAYRRLGKGKDPGEGGKTATAKAPKKTVTISTWDGPKEFDVEVSKLGDYYTLGLTAEMGGRVPKTERRGYRFNSKEDLLYHLKEQGVEEVEIDGEKINPQTAELPKRLLTRIDPSFAVKEGIGEVGISNTKGKYVAYGKTFAGKKVKLKEFNTPEEAEKYFTDQGIDKSEIKTSAAARSGKPTWARSKKQQYFEENGVKYGDVTLGGGKPSGGRESYKITASDENGNRIEKEFPTRTEAMMFLRDQGCTRIKTDRGVVDPTSVKLRDEIGKVDGKRVSKLEVGIDYDGRAYLMAEDMDGRRYRTGVTIDNPFKERKEWNAESGMKEIAKSLGSKVGISSEKIGMTASAVQDANKRWKEVVDQREHEHKMATDPEYREQVRRREQAWEEERKKAAEWERTHPGGHGWWE